MSLAAVSCFNGPVDECRNYVGGERRECHTQRLCQPDGLLDDATDLVEKRRAGISLIVFLRAHSPHGDEAALFQSRQLALYCP
jgi:hypothetical protein